MSGEALREQYGTQVCSQTFCPPWDTKEVIIPEQIGIEGELAFVWKPSKCILYCICCCPGLCCVPLCLPIAVHSINKNGELLITRHNICTGKEIYSLKDVVGTQQHSNISGKYVDSEGNVVATCPNEARKAVDEFLKTRRQRTLCSAEADGSTQDPERRSEPMAPGTTMHLAASGPVQSGTPLVTPEPHSSASRQPAEPSSGTAAFNPINMMYGNYQQQYPWYQQHSTGPQSVQPNNNGRPWPQPVPQAQPRPQGLPPEEHFQEPYSFFNGGYVPEGKWPTNCSPEEKQGEQPPTYESHPEHQNDTSAFV
eukprot:gb/GECG01006226.1/.p1 GENE.gb/GECG01006226.1/~~gb/GECG01006226.1/.p1  ORF type:complete len:310 (+),score=27.91 gb/GECG01006226.1/:1-930(+)